MIYYVYAYLDPRKPVVLNAANFTFNFEPFYIGKGKNGRLFTHLTDTRSKNSLKRQKINRIREAGQEPIVIKLAEGLEEDEALAVEKAVIAEVGTKWCIKGVKSGPLCNMTSGGDGYSLSAEQKLWLSQQNSGENNPMFGKSHQVSAKAKISKYRKTFRHSEETKARYKELRRNGNNSNAKRWILTLPSGEHINIFDLAGYCHEAGISYGALYNSHKRNQAITRGKLKGYRLIEDREFNAGENLLEQTA